MTEKTVGCAIVGAGMVARYHQAAVAACAEQGARLVAMGHYDPARFAAITEHFHVPALSFQDLLAHPEVEVVILATPSGQHAAQAMAAAAAGKHVLVEKPMALTRHDADAMIAACARAGVQLGVVLQRRMEPLFRRIHEAIQAGALGALTMAQVTMPYHRSQGYYDQAAWRGTWAMDGGGVLMNQGIHLVDLLVWFMGDPVAVQAQAATLHRAIEVEDTLVATLRFAGGALATLTATTTCEPGLPHRIELYGTRGSIQVEGEFLVRWVEAGSLPDTSTAGQGDAGASGDPGGIDTAGHIAILRDFLDAIHANRAPLVDGMEGRRSLAVVRDVYAAARIGG